MQELIHGLITQDIKANSETAHATAMEYGFLTIQTPKVTVMKAYI